MDLLKLMFQLVVFAAQAEMEVFLAKLCETKLRTSNREVASITRVCNTRHNIKINIQEFRKIFIFQMINGLHDIGQETTTYKIIIRRTGNRLGKKEMLQIAQALQRYHNCLSNPDTDYCMKSCNKNALKNNEINIVLEKDMINSRMNIICNKQEWKFGKKKSYLKKKYIKRRSIMKSGKESIKNSNDYCPEGFTCYGRVYKGVNKTIVVKTGNPGITVTKGGAICPNVGNIICYGRNNITKATNGYKENPSKTTTTPFKNKRTQHLFNRRLPIKVNLYIKGKDKLFGCPSGYKCLGPIKPESKKNIKSITLRVHDFIKKRRNKRSTNSQVGESHSLKDIAVAFSALSVSDVVWNLW